MEPDEYKDTLNNLEPGLVYASGSFNGTMTVILEDGMKVEIPNYELWRPLRGLDSDGNIILHSHYNELQVYGNPSLLDAPVLGKAFLSQVRFPLPNSPCAIQLTNVAWNRFTCLSTTTPNRPSSGSCLDPQW